MDKALLQQLLDALIAMKMEASARSCGLKICDDAIAAGQAAIVQPGQDLVYQYQLANGQWIDQTKNSYDYNVKLGQATVRALYTLPQVAQPEQPFAEVCDYERTTDDDGKTLLYALVYSLPDTETLLPIGTKLFSAAQTATERNYCERCGERLSDSEYIHTCTPPADQFVAANKAMQPLTDEVYRLARVAINEAPKHLVQDWQTAAMKVCKAIAAHIKAEKE